MNTHFSGITVFVVDDDDSLRCAIVQSYELENFKVEAISNPQDLLPRIDSNFSGVIITDVRMPKLDGISFFNAVQNIDSEIPVIFLTGHADVPMILSTLNQGAFDFFTKPVDTNHLLATTNRAIKERRLTLDNRQLKERTAQIIHDSKLLGESQSISILRETIQQVAKSDVDILLEGETGTGKKLVAQMLHQLSERSRFKFIIVNCAALSVTSADEELFGNPNNLRNGALLGQIEAAHRGTLFLNDIDSLPMEIQGRLVSVLEARAIKKNGVTGDKSLNLKVISSSQKDLSIAIRENRFRSDLLYLINTINLKIPPLRNRREDIPSLFAHFLAEATKKFSKNLPEISNKTHQRLIEYDWPGNVRELKNYAKSVILGIEDLQISDSIEKLTLPQRIEKFEANTITSALEHAKGDVRTTLKLLGIPRKTFYDKVTRHNIDINRYRK